MSQPSQFPQRLVSASGLTATINANGTLRRLDYGDIVVNLFPANELEPGLVNLYLRRHDESVTFTPLLGPGSPATFRIEQGCFIACGEWSGIRYRACLVLAEASPAWFWRVRLENTGTELVRLDLIHTQDLALASYGAIRLNEYYVSQYLDHAPIRHPRRGRVVATRQNLAVGGCHPWCLLGALGEGAACATDALQVFGFAGRTGAPPPGLLRGLPDERWQHEHAMVAIQDAPFSLAPGEAVERGFFGWLEAHHPDASSAADLAFVDRALALPECSAALPAGDGPAWPSGAGLFSRQTGLTAQDLDESELDRWFGNPRRLEERDDGHLLSFFLEGCRHGVLRRKELAVLRPHGHILRSGGTLLPDEAAMTSTVWMDGVFHSMVTQGHVSINRFLSTTHGYLSLFRSHGQRIFIETAAGWRRLDLPSAFDMRPDACRWLYRLPEVLIEIRSAALTTCHALTLDIVVHEGSPMRCLVTHHVALNGDDGSESRAVLWERHGAGVRVRALPDSDVGRRFPAGGFLIEPQPGTTIEAIDDDRCLFDDGRRRGLPFLCLVLSPARERRLRLTADLVPAPATGLEDADGYWRMVTAGLAISAPAPLPVQRLAEILPWFVHNALVHFLSPRGLEQYSGGGWGTRDVTQGPVELMLAIGQSAPVRELLLRVFRQQNPDGDWPQWFMFFERERLIRPGDSHGDIVFWPLLALAQYLVATGDTGVLEAPVPFFADDAAQAGPVPLWQHVERALALIQARVIPGTHLAAYGHGDWNDSLQPADPALRERLCSAWTVTLHYQTLTTLAQALGLIGQVAPAAALESMAGEVAADFRRHLLVDGVIAGYAYFGADGDVDYLLHPRDRRTGLTYSLLPMIHAVINDMLAPDEARQHLALIRQHLRGPDGAHLFDWPMAYRGGPVRIFQRAESSSFFGREIGNMYTHAHLRYAEALWRVGDAEGFCEALSQIVPIDIKAQVAAAAPRQANCYYSSSDAAFRDRYRAHADYRRALTGDIPLEGGWRVYSSGAGIATSLILRCLLGLRRSATHLVVDPLLPACCDGLRVRLDLYGHPFDIHYQVGPVGCGPLSLTLNGVDLPFRRLDNPYRTGGVEVPRARILERLGEAPGCLTVRLG